jgi:basic amino acid/polyamine antiporter, APA family
LTFVRSLGRWAMTGLVINCIIGSGIFGIPGELNRLLGRASPMAMILAAVVVAAIMAAIAEVASQFHEPGGAYLYAKTVFGRFVGLQVGWFSLLSIIASAAANANLFVVYLAGVFPAAGHGFPRALFLTGLIGIPAAVNYFGARSGAGLSSLLVVAKILPLLLVIVLGIARSGHPFQPIAFSEIVAPGWRSWLTALLLLVFAYGGFEYAVIPGGEVKDPKRTIPFALAGSLLVATGIYTMIQFVTVATIGTSTSTRPVADTALALMGPAGAIFIAIAVMVSTGGCVSSVMLHAPRLAYSLAAHGEFPGFLRRLHPRFRTPTVAIAFYAGLVWLLAVTGGFYIALILATASAMVMYASVCAALIQLRRTRPEADAMRIPFGSAIGVLGIVISIALMTQVRPIEAWLMMVTAVIAAANWWLVKPPLTRSEVALAGPSIPGGTRSANLEP